MSRDKLFSVIDEILSRRLVEILQCQQAFRGYVDPDKEPVEAANANELVLNDDDKDLSDMHESMVEFVY